MVFGVIRYSKADLREQSDGVLNAIELLQELDSGDVQTFQGMFAATDRWSRRARASAKKLKQLQVDVTGGVYSDIIAYSGPRGLEDAALTINCVPDARAGAFPSAVRLIGSVDALGGWQRAEKLSVMLWDVFQPGYGLSVFGDSTAEVQAELTGIPVVSVSEPLAPAEQARLFRIQDTRSQMGDRTRDTAWGSFLGSKLLSELGGFQTIRSAAPASVISALSGDGAYVRVADEPCVLKSLRCQQRFAALREFLRPVLAA